MDANYNFKIQPTWILVFDVLFAPLIYALINSLIHPASDLSLFFCSIFLIALLLYLLPRNIKMILGVPAIILTQDCLVNNMTRRSIEWHNISEIKLIGGSRSFDKIVINLRHPEEYFDTPFRRMQYNLRQLFIANDIEITANFLTGSSEEIVATMRAYWDKSAGL